MCAGDTILLSDPPKTPIAKLHKENSNVNLRDYPTYVMMHYNEMKNMCKIKKLFSCGDNGIFSNNKPCVLLLKDNNFYNVFGDDFLFCNVDTPHIGVKRKCGSLSRYIKSLFALGVWYLIRMIIYMFALVGVLGAFPQMILIITLVRTILKREFAKIVEENFCMNTVT